MFQKIAAALARAFAAIASSPFYVLEWLFGGGGGGMPSTPPVFRPNYEVGDVFDELRRRRADNERLAKRDHVETVERYLKALPGGRATIDLTGLPMPTRTALLDMSEQELNALKSAGLSAIRKFASGADHGVHGVPLVAANSNVTELKLMTPEERVRHNLQSVRRRREKQSEDFVAPKRAMR